MSKWVKRKIREAHQWDEFKKQWIEKTRPGATPCARRHARWIALREVAQTMPAAQWKEGEGAWGRELSRIRQTRSTLRRKEIAGKVLTNRSALLRAIEKEDAAWALRDREKQSRRKRGASEGMTTYRRKRKVELGLRRQIARIARQEAQIQLLEERKRKLQMEERIRQEEIAAAAANVVVSEQGSMDLIRDIKWVYEQLADLVLVSESGVRKLNLDILSKSPSNGAIAIAQYARDDPKAFLEKFVLRCVPKDMGPVEVESEAEVEERLDPGFKGLEKYLGGL